MSLSNQLVFSESPNIFIIQFAGCMVCIGRNNYFRFNHPQEAAIIKEQCKNSRFSIVPDGVYPGRYIQMLHQQPVVAVLIKKLFKVLCMTLWETYI